MKKTFITPLRSKENECAMIKEQAANILFASQQTIRSILKHKTKSKAAPKAANNETKGENQNEQR
jgi:hypothetical protein